MAGFGESWLISVMMRFTSNGARIMNEVGTASNYANRALEGTTARANAATAAMERFRASTVAVGTSIAGTFALAGAAVAGFSITAAASLQRTLTAIKNETGADPRKIELIKSQIFDIANNIGVSPVTAAKMWLDVSRLTAGQLSTAQMRQVAPHVAEFASVLNFNRPDVSTEEATRAGLQLVHLFRAYQPAAVIPLLDRVYRLSGMMAEGPNQAVRQLSYYEPFFKGLGIDDQTSIAMMALLSRAGFRFKAGTNVRAFMLQALGPLQMTKHLQEGKGGYLEAMGLLDSHANFRFNRRLPDGTMGVDYMAVLYQLANWEQYQLHHGTTRARVSTILRSVFGQQGGNIADLMADPQLVHFLAQIRAYQANPNVSLAAGARNREQSLTFQAGRAWGNFQAILTELGYVELPQITAEFKSLADTLHNVQTWLHAHKAEERWITGGFTGLVGFAALRTVLPAIMAFMGFMTGFGRLSALTNVGRLGLAWRLVDNVLTGGLIQRVLGLDTALGKMMVAGEAATSVNASASALHALAIAGDTFLASQLGRLVSAGAGILTGAWISSSQQSAATRAYDAMARRYGPHYANYLMHGNQGGSFEGWPWNFDPYGTKGGLVMPQGALSPHDYSLINPQFHQKVADAIRDGFKDSRQDITVTIVDRTSGGIRSVVSTRGAHQSNPHSPPVLGLDWSSPSLGLK